MIQSLYSNSMNGAQPSTKVLQEVRELSVELDSATTHGTDNTVRE